jgi:hypothetical protein
MAQPKTVTLYATSAFKIDGEHVAAGTILKDVESELAKELAGQGRARLATPEDLAGAKKQAAKAEA